ncbi:UNVERIFIED_CONTAM: hypothetical protein GTU68_046353 [Idotea baltica]|nr:hypothetical protein [Idotea baltica]
MYGFWQLLPIIVVANLVGLGIEFLFAAKKGHGIEEGFLVSGMLIPLIVPPAIPLWMLAMATAFAVIIGKEAFGGTGMNILNIALSARVFLFFAFPTEMSVGLDLAKVDAISGATPLGLAAKDGWAAVVEKFSVSDIFWGFIPGSVGETCKPAIFAGIGLLLLTGIASWRVMASMLLGAIVTGLIFNAVGGNLFLEVPFYYHLIMGSFFFAMAFMATDPVTAAQTNTGKLIYGFLIGVVGMVVRVLNPAYPEGWMLAILLMNVFAPMIDHYVYQANIKRRLNRANG